MHAVTTGALATIRAEVRILTDDELEPANGGTLEIGIGPLTLQINADSGCFAVWWGKDYVGGGCKK
jgi:hypothetical protein